MHTAFGRIGIKTLAAAALAALITATPQSTWAQNADVLHRQAIAAAASSDADIRAFYQARGYEPLWTGADRKQRDRRKALADALSRAGDHGLPTAQYDADLVATNLRRVRDNQTLGELEVEMTRQFLAYAHDVQSGILVPRRIDQDIYRKAPRRSDGGLLLGFSKSSPAAYMKQLPPSTKEYSGLMKAKLELEKELGRGGWGAPVPEGRTLRPGESGAAIVALRNRLTRMGYMNRSASQTFDAKLTRAVQQFQGDHGLSQDGVVGPGTLSEINQSVQYRLAQVVTAMERERWMNTPQGRGKTHIWVNLPDFHMRLIDNGRVTFQTRSVVGERLKDKRTPEFSDQMTYMEVNPDWTVPRSILGRDYLPKMQKDPNAARYLQLIDASGRQVSRDAIDFNAYTAENFPYKVKQAPGDANALGRVKFMFPNPHAIYLHDTPQKHLFSRELRAYSSGCIRLNDPFDFAYELLSRQRSDGKSYFNRILNSGQLTRINLETPIPVHLVYRTAFVNGKEGVQFRRDFYGRDAKVFRALQDAGVALRAVQG
ncbi:MAG: L,D-transpeptidase family protein [Rhodobacteraceae bacterium]|nr:L,D-transpeptidase family protein [Paracoccaceae bacterium]